MNSITSAKPQAIGFSKEIALCDAERQPCEVWTRVMGYHRPVASFNRGKQSEFRERLFFIEPGSRSVGGGIHD